ncbi:MAG: 30S ribosomal protein S4 [Candidatus Pacebacteria bacterium]|jgi:small subunit ribosomal protein S4|nr:30S ribosomal protein S4 [Candidatus Paceibacterota bacterium]MBT4652366.1 30S ribosomal protein S4 [Candidatus Paceibacterota bacterium]MBT6756193.1 30S ribosomal protein S4 [Candidatus Paceibacterota bacterium]MBT6921484.1 30S ribosomal protein S4 [Candidatus Paceibacterota bacterium]
MARYTGPKQRLQRQVGEDLGLKSNALKVARRLQIRPGFHGARRRKVSDYGNQLREKQKVKYMYGVLEKQLHRLYSEASKNPLATGTVLLSLLERRLDSVMYRLGWAPTRPAARQLVNHGHLTVNNKKMDIPSYSVKVGDVIKIKDKSVTIPVIADLLKEDTAIVPAWLEKKATIAKIKRLPEREDISEAITEQLIIEFYSR